MPAGTVKLPVPVYGIVPPLALTLTVAFPPLHRMGVAVEAAINAEGWLMVIVVVTVHPLASVTV